MPNHGGICHGVKREACEGIHSVVEHLRGVLLFLRCARTLKIPKSPGDNFLYIYRCHFNNVAAHRVVVPRIRRINTRMAVSQVRKRGCVQQVDGHQSAFSTALATLRYSSMDLRNSGYSGLRIIRWWISSNDSSVRVRSIRN
jgi:hypothetical protein